MFVISLRKLAKKMLLLDIVIWQEFLLFLLPPLSLPIIILNNTNYHHHVYDCFYLQQKRKEEKAQKERQEAFLQQINIFKAADETDNSGESILLADPELGGMAPALAANNLQNMMSNNGMPTMPTITKEDHLKYIPVEINGEKPEGFTTFWQREYVKKKEMMLEQQERMMEMQQQAMEAMGNMEMMGGI